MQLNKTKLKIIASKTSLTKESLQEATKSFIYNFQTNNLENFRNSMKSSTFLARSKFTINNYYNGNNPFAFSCTNKIQTNPFYKLSKKHLLDKDYSHLHVESTDKIYPKIKKYEYDFDLAKTDPILEEFNFFYELEDWDEALNKGFALLNLFETNPNAKIQTINLCLFLSEIFIKQEKYDNAIKLLSKAENKLDLKLFKTLEEEGLYYKYSVRLSLLKGIVALRTQKDKEGILHLKEALAVIEKQKLLGQQEINICIASDYLTILLLQAQVYFKSKIAEKCNSKIAESFEFFKKWKSSDFSLDAKRLFVNEFLGFCEAMKNSHNLAAINNNSNNNLFTEGLNSIENLIGEIKNSKTRDEFHLRFNLIWMALQAQKQIEPKNYFKKLDKFIEILDKLDLDPKLIESARLEITNLKDNLCVKSLQNIYDTEINKILLNNQFEILKILKKQNVNLHSDLILDETALSYSLLNFFNAYSNIKNNKVQERIEQIISSSNIDFIWDQKTTKNYIANLNYSLLYLKNEKILESLNNKINKGSSAESNQIINDFDKFNLEKNSKKLHEFKKLNEVDFNEIRNTSNFIQREKLKSLNSGNLNNLNNLNKISKFMQKEISLLIKNNVSNKNKTEDKFNYNIILKCFSFDNCKNKNLTDIQKLNKAVEKYFAINKTDKSKPSDKLNRNMNLSNIKIEMFNLQEIIKGKFKANPIITFKENFIDNYRVYSEEETRKLAFSVLAISNSYFKIAEENFLKLFLFFNEKKFDVNNYFKNQFVVRHNLAHKRVDFYSNLSLQLTQIIFSNKNDSVKSILNSKEAKDIELVSELKKLIAFNFVTKCYTALYFSNTDLNELNKIIKDNKGFLDDLLCDVSNNNDKIEIRNQFERLEDILKQNINNI